MASPWAKYANSVSSSVSRPRPIRNETIEIPLPSNYMSMSSSMSPPLANQPFLPPMSVPGVIGTQEQPPPYTELSFEDEDSAIENADLDDVDDDPKPTEPKENTPLVSPPELSSRRKKTASTFGSIINLCNTITASGVCFGYFYLNCVKERWLYRMPWHKWEYIWDRCTSPFLVVFSICKIIHRLCICCIVWAYSFGRVRKIASQTMAAFCCA